jgi:cupin fold WbuC family metalloprotein
MIRITNTVLDKLSSAAAASLRKRKNFNLHEHADDPVQRLFNAIEPGTYIRPHRHGDPSTWEVLYLVRGSAAFLVFDDGGTVMERLHLSAQGPEHGIEMLPDTWHTLAALEPGTIFFEVKRGPYIQPKGPHVAPWAPEEGSEETSRFEEWFRTARAGDIPPMLL